MGSSNLANFLIADGILTPKQGSMLTHSSGSNSGAFAKSVVASGALNEQNLARYIAKKTNFPFNRKLVIQPRGRAESILPLPFIRNLEIIPMSIEGNSLTVAMADPLDQGVMEQLRFFTGMKIKPVVVTFSAILRSLQKQIPDFELSPPPLRETSPSTPAKKKRKKKVKKKVQKSAAPEAPASNDENAMQLAESEEPSLRKAEEEGEESPGLTEELAPDMTMDELLGDKKMAPEEETKAAHEEMTTIAEVEEAAAPLVEGIDETRIPPPEMAPEPEVEEVAAEAASQVEIESPAEMPSPPSFQVDPALGYLNHAIAITNLSFSSDALAAAEHGFIHAGIPDGAIFRLDEKAPPSLVLQWGGKKAEHPLSSPPPENTRPFFAESTRDAWIPVKQPPGEWTFFLGENLTPLLVKLRVKENDFAAVASWRDDKRNNSSLLKLSMKLLEELIKKLG